MRRQKVEKARRNLPVGEIFRGDVLPRITDGPRRREIHPENPRWLCERLRRRGRSERQRHES